MMYCIYACVHVFPLCVLLIALEGVHEGLESLSVYVTGCDMTGGDNVSQRSDHHNPSSSEVVSKQ